jgi:hypothetical protein
VWEHVPQSGLSYRGTSIDQQWNNDELVKSKNFEEKFARVPQMLPRNKPEAPQWEARAIPRLLTNYQKGILNKEMSDIVWIAPLEQDWGQLGKGTHETAWKCLVFSTSYPVGIGDSFLEDKTTRSLSWLLNSISYPSQELWRYTFTLLYVFMALCLINWARGHFYVFNGLYLTSISTLTQSLRMRFRPVSNLLIE